MKTLVRFAALALVALSAGLRAHAQALPTASGPGLYLSAGIAPTAFQIDYGKRVMTGIAVNAGLHLRSKLGVEAEARFLRGHSDEQVIQTHVLVGPTYTIVRRGPFRPYAKFLVGGGYMRFPFNYATGSYFVMAPGAGLDIPLGSRITLRPVDVEYQSWPGFTYGGLHPYGVTAGIQIRLTRPNLYKRDPYIVE